MSVIKVEYAGQIYTDLAKYFSIADSFSIGEKLAQIEKESKKKFINMTDEEIYTTLKYLVNTKEYYKDEPLTEEEFNKWVENK